MSKGKSSGFRDDLLIVAEDGAVYHIERDGNNLGEVKRVDDYELKEHEGWTVVRELKKLGVSTAVVPEDLPPPWPRPLATCYFINLQTFKQPE